MDTAASSSGLQDLHDAVNVESSSSDDPVEIPMRLSDPALEVTEYACTWCKDALLIYVKDELGDEYPQYCTECIEGRTVQREADEQKAAEEAIIIDSDDDTAQGGDPGNSEYNNYNLTMTNGTPLINSKASYDDKPPDHETEGRRPPIVEKTIAGNYNTDHASHAEAPFSGVFGKIKDSLGHKKRLPMTGIKEDEHDDDGPGGRDVLSNWHGQRRSNETHRSTTDPDARLARKGFGKESHLCHSAHVLMENRSGLCIDIAIDEANGTAERTQALRALSAETNATQPKETWVTADTRSGTMLMMRSGMSKQATKRLRLISPS